MVYNVGGSCDAQMCFGQNNNMYPFLEGGGLQSEPPRKVKTINVEKHDVEMGRGV
jgi:hypothetical protein